MIPFIPALTTFASWFFGAAVIKVAVSAVFVAVIAGGLHLLLSLLPDWFSGTALNGLFAALPAFTWYLFDFVEFQFGFSVITGAYLTRFLIRRIPFIG